MKFYANFSFFFNQDEVWTFNKFINEFPEHQIILLEPDFYDELMNVSAEVVDKPQIVEIDKSLMEQQLQFVELNKQQRNYSQEYLRLINFAIYNKEITLGQLTKLLIANKYVDQLELKIYSKYSNQYIIESGRIFGVPLVFYDKKDLEHKHSLYLVDYCVDCQWFQLYRKIRLSLEVNKQFLLILFSKEGEIVNTKKIQNFK
ncbi:unnamed protein product (macronuclear) [Paramecium tetraurelia]|uniref:tRNA-intron lyase n=1 Tax=Paramecium tetraurelia TaxID=5888 RepID=A0E729_PARTE|nr:uncharacterized protein GSPATT00023824001 [Paramecium tetraurelia]CAK91096.1 unnamed protein product [Paramecium tetraurelia]|eukprot:XP_001458493.1 hypothetical protein (macronuclear) [Paramecium tetraurelia strain d4-2]